MINEIKQKIERFLQIDCDDFWCIHKEDDSLIGIYAGLERFKLEFDDEDWYFTGSVIPMNIVSRISEIINEAYKERYPEIDEI